MDQPFEGLPKISGKPLENVVKGMNQRQ